MSNLDAKLREETRKALERFLGALGITAVYVTHDRVEALRACLQGLYQPVLGPALLAKYEDVLGRSELFADSVLSAKERGEVFDGLMSRCRWIEVFYAWRPNLPDEADNHLIELAVAAQADAIVTRNLRDVARGELKFPMLRVLTPEQCLEAFPCPP